MLRFFSQFQSAFILHYFQMRKNSIIRHFHDLHFIKSLNQLFFYANKAFFFVLKYYLFDNSFSDKELYKKFRNKKFTPQYHLNACDSGCLLHVRSTVFHNCTTSTYSGSRRVLVFLKKNYGQSLRSKTTTG